MDNHLEKLLESSFSSKPLFLEFRKVMKSLEAALKPSFSNCCSIPVTIHVLLHASSLLTCLAFEGHCEFVHFSLANLVCAFSAEPNSFMLRHHDSVGILRFQILLCYNILILQVYWVSRKKISLANLVRAFSAEPNSFMLQYHDYAGILRFKFFYATTS